MLCVLLTSVLSNDQPFSCACERVAVTLTGDALRDQSIRAGLYSLIETSLNRPVYRKTGCNGDGDDQYLHLQSVGTARTRTIFWLIGPDCTSTSGGLSTSVSPKFTCPEHVSSWEFVATTGEWSSSGGVDVACCAAGSTCGDSFEDACTTGTSTDSSSGPGPILGLLAFGFGIFILLWSIIDALVTLKEKAALRSDAASHCEGRSSMGLGDG